MYSKCISTLPSSDKFCSVALFQKPAKWCAHPRNQPLYQPCISQLQVSKSNENPTETSFRKGLSVFQKVTIQCDSFAITSTRVFWNITHWEHPFSPSQILGKTKTKESHELQSTISDILQGPYRKRFSLPNPFIQWICCFHCGKVNLSCS